jgi:2-phospho-L-lactate/phosphoenolpyruvate guanylyltransferase
VQATVRTFDPATRAGTVLLDDGLELPYDGAAFDAGGLRLLRVGQRVRLRFAGEPPAITFLTVATLADPR